MDSQGKDVAESTSTPILATSATIGWLVFDRMTGRLLLEVRHVPTNIKERTLVCQLVSTGYWPVPITHDSVASEFISLGTTLDTPGMVLKQITGEVRHVEWRELWTKE